MAGNKKNATKGKSPKSSDAKSEDSKPKKRGWDEIESLFSDGKKQKKEQKSEEAAEKKKKKELQKARRNQSQQQAPKAGGEWVDDGLGGVYNSEGYTGRVEDGVKVFKAHILRKPNAGETPDCPFDCKCCYI